MTPSALWKCLHFAPILNPFSERSLEKGLRVDRTWAVSVLLLPLAAHTEEGVDVAQQDEGRRQDRLLVVGHDEMVALVLPHQVGDGLDLQIDVAGGQRAQRAR